MLGVSEAEKIAGLAPDLQGLLDQRGVAKDLQAGLYDLGVTSLAMLSAVAMDRGGLEGLAKSSLGIDTDARPTDAIKFATLFLAWQSAKKRITVRDEQDAEAEVQRAPKPIPGVELQLYRAEFQKRFYKLKDSECPGKPSFEDLCEQLDAGELRAMSLRHFGSRNEDDEAETGNIQLGKSGTLKIKKAKIETANPGNLEEFRTKIMLLINHFIFARFRFPNKEVLSDITPFTALEYLNYICSKDVAQMGSQSVEGVSMHRPSLKLIIHYEYQMRKEAVDLVNKGTKLGEALRQVTKDSDVRERHFSTPLAVSSATQAVQQDPWRQRQKGERQHPYEVLQHLAKTASESIAVETTVFDILRDRSQDLLNESTQAQILDKLKVGYFDAVIMSSHVSLIRRLPNDQFATAGAAAYPPAMDFWLARHLFDSFLKRGTKRTYQEVDGDHGHEPPGAPSVGVSEGHLHGVPEGHPADVSQGFPAGIIMAFLKGKGRLKATVTFPKCTGVAPLEGQALGKEAAVLAGVFWQAVDGFMEGLGKKGLLKLVSELALGRHVESPFQAVMHDLRHRLDGCLKKLGQDPSRRKGDVKTEIAYRRLRAWAALVGDDDHQFLADMAATGVPLGVRSEIPWVSAVYDKKDRRSASDAAPGRWEEDVPGDPTLRDNYASAKDHMEKVKRHIAKDVEKGWMVKMSKEEATARYGEDLQVASLGAVPKDKDWSDVRVVHDATHGLQVNTQVDQPNQLAFPQFDDLEAVTKAFREQADPRRFLLAFGIKSAHRLVPIHPRDWGLQACRLDCEEEILVNTRGTFGVATAAFWWGRVAGLVFRVYHRLLPAEAIFYLLLFADDGLMFSSGQQYHRHLLGLFMFLEVMEIPLSWSKTRGGVRTEWIGYTVDLQQWKIGISEKKVQWLRSWTAGALAQGRMLGREFKAGLGRMGFLAGISKRARPFLAPMYAASAQVRGGSFFELHLATKLAIKFFEGTITSEPMRPLSTQPEVLGEIFRVDAMADNDGVAIGGWETYSSSDPKLARWFHVKLSRGSAPGFSVAMRALDFGCRRMLVPSQRC
ncbi:Uncharacterized protein SCF082_LOCUS18037 [Durusdinium trenchii]|uniref:Uncharacterized protein n=1 Tax=Durusdinium trenchii TaxID=1381693 RepID=A0ABP0KLG9_9DINO